MTERQLAVDDLTRQRLPRADVPRCDVGPVPKLGGGAGRAVHDDARLVDEQRGRWRVSQAVSKDGVPRSRIGKRLGLPSGPRRVGVDLEAAVKRPADRVGLGLSVCVVVFDSFDGQTTTCSLEDVPRLEFFFRLEDVLRVLGNQRDGLDRVHESPHARMIA